MSDQDPEIDHERLYVFPSQSFTLPHLTASHPIVDIGGGGEGVIGQLEGGRVIAIDPCLEELAEAPPGPQKLLADGVALPFSDESVEVITAFCTLMYVDPDAHTCLFQEAARALRPGGQFLIWGLILPTRPDHVPASKDIAVFPLWINLPQRQIETGYGVLWPERRLDAAYYTNLAEESGFALLHRSERGLTFSLELQRSHR
jgi:SAM-dependent methyltransferase